MNLLNRFQEIGRQTKPNNTYEALFHSGVFFGIFMALASSIYLMVCMAVPALLFNSDGWLVVLRLSGMFGIAILLSNFLSMFDGNECGNN